jgi:hypothetical protein
MASAYAENQGLELGVDLSLETDQRGLILFVPLNNSTNSVIRSYIRDVCRCSPFEAFLRRFRASHGFVNVFIIVWIMAPSLG